VCLLNVGAAGSETMKNLVLGGIASFTVVDAQVVEASDLGSNFLVDAASLGATRAATVCGLLQELNPSVTGSFVEERPETLIESNPNFFNGFTLVIATQLPEQVVVKLDALLREKNIPMVTVRAYGLVGAVRVSVEEHCVVEVSDQSQNDPARASQGRWFLFR
jgi:amyloid beta precursor protein binding protein 1